MKGVDSKLLLGLVVGAAVGAAVAYLATSGKGEQIFEELKEAAGKVKEGFDCALEKAKETGSEVLKAVQKPAAE